jgi:hypothetical protein
VVLGVEQFEGCGRFGECFRMSLGRGGEGDFFEGEFEHCDVMFGFSTGSEFIDCLEVVIVGDLDLIAFLIDKAEVKLLRIVSKIVPDHLLEFPKAAPSRVGLEDVNFSKVFDLDHK